MSQITPQAAAAEVAKMVQGGVAFYPAMLKVCAKAGLSYEQVRAEYLPGEAMPEVYNAHGRRVA